jgi:4'-phosphopantetheinyl transferase
MADARNQAGVPVRWRGVAPSANAGAGAGGAVAGAVDACRLVADSSAADIGDVAVIGVPDQSDRDRARAAIREAIVAELAERHRLPRAKIVLHSAEGQVPWAQLETPTGPRHAWLAISHDGALSVAAISLHGAVGIDVTQVNDIPDWEPVARDYLGPDVAAALAALPAGARADAFARAWCEREARLKYLGRELVEWSADGDAELAACRCLPLCLPEGYVGALTLPANPSGAP